MLERFGYAAAIFGCEIGTANPFAGTGKNFWGQPPPSLIRQQKEMKKTLKFQLQHGPQTRA